MPSQFGKGKPLIEMDLGIVLVDKQGLVKGLDRLAEHAQRDERPAFLKERIGKDRIDLQRGIECFYGIFRAPAPGKCHTFVTECLCIRRPDGKGLGITFDGLAVPSESRQASGLSGTVHRNAPGLCG